MNRVPEVDLMHRVAAVITRVLLCTVLSSAVVTQGSPIARAGQTFSVIVVPNTAGDQALYHLGGATCSLSGVDGLRLYFPDDTSRIDTTSLASLVRVNGVPALGARYVDSATGVSLDVSLATSLSKGDTIDIAIDRQAGLVNPTWPRVCYMVRVALLWHGVEVGVLGSNQYTIVQSTVEQLVVVSSPPVTAIPSEYGLSFVTGVNGTLKASEDFVKVHFDGGVRVPDTLTTSEIYVNDVSCRGRVYRDPVERETLIVYLPRDVARESKVQIRFSSAFGLRNPAAEGTVQVVVSTSVEPQQVASNNVQIVGPKVSGAVLSLADAAVTRPLVATFAFRTSEWGALTALDRIFIEVPPVYLVPLVSAPSVTLNDQVVAAELQGRVVSVVGGYAIGAQSPVTVVLPASLGFVNPTDQGPQAFAIWTSRDSHKVSLFAFIEDSVVTAPRLSISTHASIRTSRSLSSRVAPDY
jgi:hypothetical protein